MDLIHRPGELQASFQLEFLSKLLDRVVQAPLQAHPDGSSLYPGWQSAYRRLHISTETVVTKVFSDQLVAVDRGQMSALCLLDLSSAFDTVDHDLLLQRLDRQFGLCGRHRLLHWIRAYFSGRTVHKLFFYRDAQSFVVQKRNATIRGPRHFLRSGPLPSDLK